MSNKLLLFPFGGNAKEALDAVEALNKFSYQFEILGFVDDNPSMVGKHYAGVKVLGGREIFEQIWDAKVLAVVGSPENFMKRKEIIDGLKLDPSRFISVIHPSAALAKDARVGINTLILPHVVLSPGVKIGDHCLILSNTSVGHDSVIASFCCVAANVAIAGFVTIEQNCYIGAGAVIRDHINVESKSMVGCGANVITDVEKQTVVAGNPAKMIKKVMV